MVSKLDEHTFTCEFESHWVHHLYGLVQNLSEKKLSKSCQGKVCSGRELFVTSPTSCKSLPGYIFITNYNIRN